MRWPSGSLHRPKSPLAARSAARNRDLRARRTQRRVCWQLTLRETALAGALVAAPMSFVYTPVERLKVLRQLGSEQPFYSHTVRSLYRGFWATLARDVPAWGAYFFVYTALKRRLAHADSFDGSQQLAPAAICVAGAAAGAATWGVAYPIDSLKSLAQREVGAQRTPYLTLARNNPLFAGMLVAVVGGAIRDLACFAGVESTQRALTLWQ